MRTRSKTRQQNIPITDHASMSRRASIIFLIVMMVIIADWSSKYAAVTWFSSAVVYDHRQASYLVVPLFLFICAALFWLVDDQILDAGIGIFTGAWMANLIDRGLSGQVADFIPGGKMFPNAIFDLADICLLVGAIGLVIGLVRALTKGRIGLQMKKGNFFTCIIPINLWIMVTASITVICLEYTSGRLAPALLGPDHVLYNSRSPFLPALICTAVAIAYLCRSVPGRVQALALGLIIGGGGINLAVRFLQGSVPDFITVPLPGSMVLQTNLADIAICGGAMLLVFLTLAGRWENQGSKETQS